MARAVTKRYQSDRKARRSRDTSVEYSTVGGITNQAADHSVSVSPALRARFARGFIFDLDGGREWKSALLEKSSCIPNSDILRLFTHLRLRSPFEATTSAKRTMATELL
jgi:hypothetical protein